jgi:peroxiredoxin
VVIAHCGFVDVEVLRMRVRVAVAGMALALVLSGCGASPTGPAGEVTTTTGGGTSSAPSPSPQVTGGPSPQGSGAPSPQKSGAAADVPETLRFTVATVDGPTFDGATLAGKPAVLWFWAAWCPRCRAKAGEVAAVAAEYAGRAQVIGVAGLGSGPAPMKKFVSDTRIGGFPNLADDQGTVWQRFGVTAQEYFVILDRSGRVTHKGTLTGDDLRRKVDALAG